MIVFGGLILAKVYVDKHARHEKVLALSGEVADFNTLSKKIKTDSLYDVREVFFRDSAVLIAVANPDKTSMEAYFDKKYRLNHFDNINLVCIYQYDSLKPLSKMHLEDAIMAKGKRLGRFQDEWVSRFMDTTDGSCAPLKQYLKASIKNAASFKNELTSYQPENIYKMRVICKYSFRDTTWQKSVNDITALIDTGGKVVSLEKITN